MDGMYYVNPRFHTETMHIYVHIMCTHIALHCVNTHSARCIKQVRPEENLLVVVRIDFCPLLLNFTCFVRKFHKNLGVGCQKQVRAHLFKQGALLSTIHYTPADLSTYSHAQTSNPCSITEFLHTPFLHGYLHICGII